MYLLYSLAFSLAFAALLPYFIYQSLRHGKYLGSFKQRLGILPAGISSDSWPTIWVHAVSVGEFLAAKPLIDRITSELPAFRVAVSTTTVTGQRLAREKVASTDAVFYFPFDWGFTAGRALSRIKPSCVVIIETELWPNFLRECRRRGVATVIANGRISDRSYSGYRKAGRFIKRVLQDITLFVMQSEADAARARMLGAPSERVLVCGNLKFDQPAHTSNSPVREGLNRFISSAGGFRLIVAGSTAQGEEEILLDAFKEILLCHNLADTRLLIAPRHPERFDAVAEIITRSGFRVARRTWFPDAATGPNGGDDADVLLLDSIGELSSVYEHASVVFVGGSLVPRGGHNVIEPASRARAIITGPHTENFRSVVDQFVRAGAMIQLKEDGADRLKNALAREFVRLLDDDPAASAMGERARALIAENTGAADRTVSAIRSVIQASQAL